MGHLVGFLETAKPVRGKLRPSRRGLLFTLLPTLPVVPRAAAQMSAQASYWYHSFQHHLSLTLAQCPCTLTSFPRADAGHSGEHPLKEKLPEALQRQRLPGDRMSFSRAGSSHAGHPFVLCPGDREGSTSGPGVMGSRGYRGCSWKAGLMHPGQPGPAWTSTSLAGQKSCASPCDSWGQG